MPYCFFCIDHSIDTESALLHSFPSISSHDEACKVFKDIGMYFGHANSLLHVNSLLSKIEELRTLAFTTNISVLRITETKLSKEELKI